MSLKGIFRKSFRESKKRYLYVLLHMVLIYLMQKKSRHFAFLKLCSYLLKINVKTVLYYKAEFYFFYAKYKKALNNINLFLEKYPLNIDGKLLKIRLLYLLSDKNKALYELKKIQRESNRLKIWMLISKLVDTKIDLKNMEKLYLRYIEKEKINTSAKIEIQKYISSAAASIGAYDIAEYYLKSSLNLYEKSSIKNTKKKYFSKYDASVALEDLSNVFNALNIKFFLVSGTFLGCIREKNFISNDYDIDVGIWNEDFTDKLRIKLERYGTFYIHDPKWKGGIKLKHINGILIDIFIHYKDGYKHYHLGSAVRWYNSTFDLIKYKFLGKEYFGFKEYDRYLSENYGNWRIPKKNFDNILDTPNAVVFNEQEYKLHLYRLSFKRTKSINN